MILRQKRLFAATWAVVSLTTTLYASARVIPSTSLFSLHRRDTPITLGNDSQATTTANFTNAQMGDVLTAMNTSSTMSWELGTAAEALLEYSYPQLSVYSSTPPFSAASGNFSASSIADVLYYVRRALQQRGNSTQIINDGAAGDPASLGVAAILGNLTGADSGLNGVTFAQAAYDQLQTLLVNTPKSSTGAISHRTNEVALWDDSVYMVPPFLAYYGVVTGNTSLIANAVQQISLYRDALRQSDKNLWAHILQSPTFNDPGLWGTGNAWAAAGMSRVLATIQNSQYADSFKNERQELVTWIDEIHQGFYGLTNKTTATNYNYVDQPFTFQDAASSALMASSVFRLAVLTANFSSKTHFIPQAQAFRNALASGSGTPTLSSQGYLQPVVNPLNFTELNDNGKGPSPEGQSFVVLMEAAHRDWALMGARGDTSGVGRRMSVGFGLAPFVVLVTTACWLLQ